MKLSFKEIQYIKSKSPNNARLHLNKASIVKKCEFCGKLYTPTHHLQKFCSDFCYKEHRKDYKATWKRTKYKPKQRLGTSTINETRNKDFKKEHEILQRELYRIGKR